VVTVKLFVEGGGDSDELHRECRKGFRLFLEAAGLRGAMPRIVACGSRQSAYDDYCTAIRNDESAVLLVDSEAPVADGSVTDVKSIEAWRPWVHLKARDNWDKPVNADDRDCHLMVELMEAWFLADASSLKAYYKQGFNEKALLAQTDIEAVSKANVISSLEKATRKTLKGTYSKGGHSFEILAGLDPQAVTSKSPWAKRFVELLTRKMHKVSWPDRRRLANAANPGGVQLNP
jgi:hypothetical protein